MNTVAENFNIDEVDLADKSEESSFWERSYKFFMDVKDVDTDDLSESQMSWLMKIERAFVE